MTTVVVGCANSECMMWNVVCHVSGVTDSSANLLGVAGPGEGTRWFALVGWEMVE